MEKLTRKLEIGACIAIILMAVVTASILIPKRFNRYFAKRVEQAPPLKNGDHISIPNQDWGRNGRTLVLVLSTNCHFCSESAPFYRKIMTETANESHLHIAAVFPQSVEDGRGYLAKLGVAVPDVQQVQAPFEVQATPTLILVSDQGTVVDSWVGKISANEEPAVIAKMTAKTN